jgi:hypothetical protein
MKTTAHPCKDLSNHCNHCNINGHTKEKCWKLHPDLNRKNHYMDVKKNNLLDTYSSNEVVGTEEDPGFNA